MEIAVHVLLFLLSSGLLWFFAGILIEAVDAVARKFKRSGFTVAFFFLGALTSIGEISVMVNSTINGAPEVSAGNLIGSSFVILLFVIPILAIVGNGVWLKKTLNKKQMAIALFTILLPALLVLDGNVTVGEGVICLLSYVTLLYFIREGRWWWQKNPNSIPEIIDEVEEQLVATRQSTAMDIIKMVGGAAVIFFAGNLLVDEAVYFSELLNVPGSVIGLVLLSIGTNIPEVAIAVRAIRKNNIGIAFGNYLGSAVAITAIFGFLAIFNGEFQVEASNFFFTAALMLVGFFAFFVFSNSRQDISRKEGLALISLYASFLILQITSIVI